MSLALFRDRNFSLANVAITTLGFAVTAQAFPITLYAQGVRGLTPTGAALLLAPTAVISTILAPFVGRLTDRAHPRWIAGFGLGCFAVGLLWLAAVMRPDTPMWAAGAADRAHRDRQRLHVGADQHRGDAQPADEPGRRGCGRLQHHAPGRRGAGQRRHRRAHAVAARGRGARRGRRERRGRRSRSCRPRCTTAFSTAMAQSLVLPAVVILVGDRGRALLRHPGPPASRDRAEPATTAAD